jgi:hypothetical protein
VSGEPSAILEYFSKGFSQEEEESDGVATEPCENAPMLTNRVARLGCTGTQETAVGNHNLHVSEVAAGRLTRGAKTYVDLRMSDLSL